MKRGRTEIRDGQEFRVTVLPQDRRLAPSAGKKRAVWASMTRQDKREHFRRIQRAKAAKARAAKRKRKRKSR